MVTKAAGAGMLDVMALVVGPDVFGQLAMEIVDGSFTADIVGGNLTVHVKETAGDELSRDAVYMDSLTFAGLVVFGSTILMRASRITNQDRKRQNAGAVVAVCGTWILAGVHISYRPTGALVKSYMVHTGRMYTISHVVSPLG